MPSEIARLRPNKDLQLFGNQPYVIISGGDAGQTKQEARKRLVPVVFGADLLRERLPEAIRRLSEAKEPSATISKRLKTKIGEQYSSHCLRHTFRANGSSASINPMHLQAIGGWTGAGINKVMLDYGTEGLEHSEMLATLTGASRQIHRHLLAHLDHQPESNVIPITR